MSHYGDPAFGWPEKTGKRIASTFKEGKRQFREIHNEAALGR